MKKVALFLLYLALLALLPGCASFKKEVYFTIDNWAVRENAVPRYYAVYDVYGPVAVRIPKDCEGQYQESCVTEEQILISGTDITLAGYGSEINELLAAADNPV